MMIACGNFNKSDISKTINPNLPTGTFTIITLVNNKDIPKNLTLTFNAKTNSVSGFSGCNRFFGNYNSENNSIKINSLASSKMLCNEEAHKTENDLLQALEKSTSFSSERDTLRLYSEETILLEAVKKITLSYNVSFEYVASGRNSYQKILINKDQVSKTKKRGKNLDSKSYNTSDWEQLISYIDAIDIANISALEVPSKDFQFDGAPMARLIIISDEKIYETPSFDHGNPPKEIAPLIEKLISISENIE
jgi:heat shock protein HslJ